MEVLWASNNVNDWGNSPVTQANTSYYDSTRVPYGIEMDINDFIPMKAFHKAPSSDTVWYHTRFKAGLNMAAAQDGYLVRIVDSSGDAVAGIDLLNGGLAPQAFGDTNVTGGYSAQIGVAINTFDVSVVINGSGITTSLYIGEALISSAFAANTGGKGVARRWDWTPEDSHGNAAEHTFSEFIVAETDTRGTRMTRLDPSTTFGNDSDFVGIAANLSDEDDSTGLSSGTAAERTSAPLDTLSGSPTIGAVVAVARAIAGVTGPSKLKQYARISATNYDGTEETLTQGKEFYVQNWEDDPSDALPWDTAGVNAIEIGLLSVT